jgi:hypothetical protein
MPNGPPNNPPTWQPTDNHPYHGTPDSGRWPRLLDASTCQVVDIAHEVVNWLNEAANIAKWLFASNLAVCLGSPITTERNTTTGLVIAPSSCVGVDGVLATKHPKTHQNGHLPPGLQFNFHNHL